MKWVFCQDDFIAADVIRWREGVWESRRSKRKQSVHVGERLITAEIIQDDTESGIVTLLIRACQVLSDKSVRGKVQPLTIGDVIRRQRKTLHKSETARLRWSDETARALLTQAASGEVEGPPANHILRP